MRLKLLYIVFTFLTVAGLNGQGDIILTNFPIPTTDVRCNGGSDGTIIVTVTGGNGDLTYNLATASFFPLASVTTPNRSYTFTGYPAGDYVVSIQDPDPSTSNTGAFVSIGTASAIQISSSGSTDATCNGGNNGTATITVTGGTPGYSFYWEGQNTGHTSTDQDPTNLFADTYDLIVTDIALCSKVFAGLVVVAEPDAISRVIESLSHVSCFGGTNGSADISISGGTLPYTYSWTNTGVYASTQEDPTGMPADTYTLQITDGNACVQNFPNIFTITQPNDITATFNNSSDALCFGSSDGTAQVTVAEGTPGYTFLWTGDATTHTSTMEDPTDLIKDTYDLEVTDANLCIKTFNDLAVIDEPADLSTSNSVVDILCFDDNTGEIDLSPSGGTAPYSFAWTGPDGFTASSEDITGLTDGDYTVIVTDDHLCTESPAAITVNQASEITLPTTGSTDVLCNGGNDGTATITVTGGTPPYTFSWDGQGTAYNSTDQNPTDLIADTYNLTVTDNTACSEVFAAVVIISEPNALTQNIESITNVTCFGFDNGMVDITVSGGALPYTYAWTNVGATYTSAQEDPTGMPPDTYSLKITDGNLCEENFINIFTITEPNDITASLNGLPTDALCFGSSDGTAQVTVAEGTPGYTYLWTGDATAHTSTMKDPTDLIKDTYDLQVTDNNSCVKSFNDIAIIDEPTDITTTNSVVDILCFDDNTGEIDLSPSGGTAPYSFAWTGPNGYTASIEDITGLFDGDYTVIVTDDHSCTESPAAITVNQASEITLPTTGSTDVLCNGGNDGTATITVTGGTPPYTFSWDGQGTAFNSTDQNPTDLIADTYNLTVTDNAACSQVFTSLVVVAEPNAITQNIESITNVSCFGLTDGSADITISGGTLPYTYSWTNTGAYTSTQEDPTGMPADTYTLQITDGNACVQNFPNIFTITQPNDITATFNSSSDALCFGSSDGTAQVTVAEGTPGYTFLWTGDATTHTSTMEDPTDLIKDTYDLQVTDNNSCVKSFNDIAIIDEPTDITTTNSVVDILCFDDNTGEIDLSPSGGTAPYSFAWTGPNGYTASIEDITGLFDGDYTVIVTDDHSCTESPAAITVNQASEITLPTTGSTDVLCNGGNDGTATITVTGGTPPYTFSWDGQGTAFNSTDQNPTGLIADTYNLTVTDNAACSQVFTSLVVVAEPNAITQNIEGITNVSCFGLTDAFADITISGGTLPYTYAWTNAGATYTSAQEDPTGMPSDTYSVKITDGKLCEENFINIFTISEPNDITATLNSYTNTTCFGCSDGTAQITVAEGTPAYSYLWTGDATGHTSTMEDPTDLIADTYDLQIIDANSCVKTFNDIVNIGQPNDITAILNGFTDALCFGNSDGTAQVTVAEGTPPYTFIWTGDASGHTSTMEDPTDLIADTYDLQVTDANSYIKTFNDIVTIAEPSGLTITSSLTNILCFGGNTGEIDISPSGGTLAYTYAWTGPGTYTSTDEDITGLLPGDYSVTVTDNNSCTESHGPITISQADDITLSDTSSTNVTCFGNDNGTASITVIGGSGTYTAFSWDGQSTGHNSTDENPTGLVPDIYDLTITDDNACVKVLTDLITITEPLDISVSQTTSDISCNGAGDGAITITPAGGTPAYTYLWSGPNSFTSSDQNISTLEAGEYDLTVTDNNSCVKIFAPLATITEPLEIGVTVTNQKNPDCFGDSNGTIDIDVSEGTPPYAFSWTNSLGTIVSTDEDPTGLSDGTFSLDVTDSESCAVSYPNIAVLTEPALLETTLTKTDILCNGETNGTITITPSGGTAPYAHSFLSDFSALVSSPATGLSENTYTVYTRDANGCQTSGDIDIVEPLPISYTTAISEENLCNGDSSVTITFSNVLGGISPYEYSVNNGLSYQADSVFEKLPAGSYPVIVRDANLCEQLDVPLIILEPDSINIIFYDQDDVSTCYTAQEGRIDIEGEGGTGALSYSLNGGTTQSDGEFLNITGGIYTVNIIDANLCQKDTIVELVRPEEIVYDIVNVTDVTGCTGDSNGEISVIGSGGTGALEYSFDGGLFMTAATYTGLSAGDYTITIRDDLACTVDSIISITEPLPISISSETVKPVSCSGASSGEISVVAENGTPPYTFSLTPAVLPAQATGDFIGLPIGVYTITVDDAEGCDPAVSNTLTITEPPAIVHDSTLISKITCKGANDGKIAVYVSGGTPPFEYSFDNGINYVKTNSSNLAGLNPGNYDVSVTDSNTCTLFIDTYIIEEPPVLSISAILTDVFPCNGDSNGEISATGVGGWNSYEYSIDGLNFDTSGDFSGLIAGEYTLFLRDTGKCSTSSTVTISEPTPVIATVDKTDYIDNELGKITISDVSGGVPPYEYAIDGLTGTFTSDTSYTGVIAGVYDVVVRDANGCTFEETIEISDIVPLNMIIDSADVSCFGLDDGSIEFLPQDAVGIVQYSIDGGLTYSTTALFENLQGNRSYSLKAVDDDDKQFTGSVYINEPDQLFVYIDAIVPAKCNVFSATGSVDLRIEGGTGDVTVTWSNGAIGEDANGLLAGRYSADILDEENCLVTKEILIPASTNVSANAGEDTTICAGETIILNATPEGIMQWNPATYLSNQTISNPVALNVTDSISYIFTVTETSSGNNCYNFDTLNINILPTYGLEVSQDSVGLKGQRMQIVTTTTGTFVSYEWVPESGLDVPTDPNPTAILENTITYMLLATNDYGCIETDSMHIEVVEDLTVYNVFSPNGDNINDYFAIKNASAFPEIIVKIFNRWGSGVFTSVGYEDDQRWDGTFNGRELPIGTYYYVIIPYPEANSITGNVTIIR